MGVSFPPIVTARLVRAVHACREVDCPDKPGTDEA